MRDCFVVFLVATLAYLAIALFWLARDMNHISGDEPHYLVVAQALVDNHSLDLRPVYDHGPWADLGEAELHNVVTGDALLPGHGLAIALLVALPYRFFGVAGAKVTLCLLAALLVSTTFFPALLQITGRRGWSLAAALVTALSLPYTMAAGQIYPDLVAGLLQVYLLTQLARGFPACDRRWPRLCGIALAAGALPWLHHRHLLVAGVFASALMVRFLRDSCAADDGAAGPGGLRAALCSRPVLISLVLMCGLLLVEVTYMLSMFGTLAYPDWPRFQGWYSAMILLGVHLDQFHGIFFQNPLFFAGLAGLPLFLQRAPRLFALWAVLYACSVAAVCLFPAGYGGWAFAGRYEWDFAPLWVFPLGYFIVWLLERRGGEPLLAVMLSAAMLVQARFALDWIPTDGFLIQDTRRPLWTLGSFYGDLRWLLPLFGDSQRMWTHRPNWVWMALAALVASLCVLPRMRRTAGIGGVCVASGVAAALLVASPRVSEPLEISGASLPKATGRDDGLTRIANEGQDAAGFIAFGPYLMLGPGCYETVLFYEAHYPRGADPATWEHFARRRVLERGELPAAGGGGTFRSCLRVPPGERIPNFEFRVLYGGRGRIRIVKLVIAPATGCSEPGSENPVPGNCRPAVREVSYGQAVGVSMKLT